MKTAPIAESESDLDLALHHVAARRDYYPHWGEVRLDLILDGRVLTADNLVLDGNVHTQVFRIPRQLLVETEHRLVIRTNRNTNTTYRLLRVVLGSGSG